MTRDRYLPGPAFRALPVLLLALAFSACDPASGPDEAAGPSRLVSRYEISGDRVILSSPTDTMRFCDGDSLVEDSDGGRPDTTYYRLAGNRLWMASDFQSRPPDGPSYTLRRHTGLKRLSGGEGVGGWWRWDTAYNEILAGTLDPDAQADQERYLRINLAQLRYVEIDLGFFDGEFRMRQDGRMAELFLAEWNGEIDDYPGFPPDSAEYAIEVSIVDPYTVRLTGRETGERVTVTYDRSRMDTRYASSDPDREPYWEREGPTRCPAGEWYEDFQWENAKGLPALSLPALKMGKKPGLAPFPGAHL
jgi:hypothetical protein